jgi:hypothetical protein
MAMHDNNDKDFSNVFMSYGISYTMKLPLSCIIKVPAGGRELHSNIFLKTLNYRAGIVIVLRRVQQHHSKSLLYMPKLN